MIELTENFIPELNKKLSITKFDNKSFLICIDDDKPTKFVIPQATKLLIDQVDGKRTISAIADSFNKETGSGLDTDMIIKIFQNKLLGYGVLENDSVEKVKVKDNYLKLRFILFPENLVKHLVKPFLALFDINFFMYSFFVCMALLTVVYTRYIDFTVMYKSITPEFTFWFVAINVTSIIFHELGHAGACRRFGAKSGAIGFGFYILTPVFYADVTDAWRLRRKERLVVDLAGIYMQMLFSLGLCGIFLVTKTPFYLYIAFLISTTIIININPFLRFDGYWALCDLLNVPNMRENSLKLMKQFFRKVVGKATTWKASKFNVFLVVYAILSLSFIFYFITLMLIFKRSSILYFPRDVYYFFATIISDFRSLNFEWFKSHLSAFLLPLIFYLALYRILKRRFQTLKTKTHAL